ncbi:MAG: AMP-binding protein [Candidatus Kerfeldbacteria bacterium]|nr:AMP-binding protein [Candidatus Kerfeldbacteria bacterium]
MYLDWQKVSRLPRAEQQDLQNQKVRWFFRHKLPYSPYYRRLLEKLQLSWSDFKTTDDIQKLPLTSKADIAPTVEDRARPRQFILQPDEHLIKKHATKGELLQLVGMKIRKLDAKAVLEKEYKPVHIHFTTGRTALPTPFTYSTYDLMLLRETGRRLFNVAGLSRDNVGLNAFPYSPHLGFWLAYYGFLEAGITALATGGGKIMGTQKIMDSLERLKVNAMAIIPGYCYHLLREAVKQRRDFSNLKYIFFGAERVSPAFREKVKELLRHVGASEVSIQATYASTEFKTAWIQCAEHTGYHLYPDLEFVELVDEDGRRVKEDESGEVVYTALDWRGTVVVRYRTGDLAQGIEYTACPNCGRTVPRILPDIQRRSDMKEFHLTKIKGELVNLNNVFPIMSGIKGLDEWQLVIRKKNNDPHDLDELVVHVSAKEGAAFNQVRSEVEKKMRDEMQVGVMVEEKTTEELIGSLGMETELKEKRILDSRPKQ